MKKNLVKRALSTALCIALFVSCLSITSLAAGGYYSASTNVYEGSTFKGVLTCTVYRYASESHGNEEFRCYAEWSGSPAYVQSTVEVVNYLTGATIAPRTLSPVTWGNFADVWVYPAIVQGRRYTTYGCAEVFSGNFSGLVRKTVVDV